MGVKDQIPWNKGLSMDDPRVRDNVEKRNATMLKKYGTLSVARFRSYEPFSEETKKKMSVSKRRNWKNPEYREKVIEAQSEGKRTSEKFSEAQSKRATKQWTDPEHRKWFKKHHLPKMVEGWKNSPEWRKAMTSLEYRESQAKVSAERWKDPEYKQKTVKAVMKAIQASPNNAERKLLKALNGLLPEEYKFVGDGSFVLGGYCPDFLNVNGQKKLVELFGDYWHRNDDPQKRVRHFKKFGFSTLIVWEHELENQALLSERILEFNQKEAFHA